MATREELLSFIQECDDTELLEEIGAGNHPMLTVYNKIDLVPELNRGRESDGIYVSAETGEGLYELVEKISQEVSPVRA